YLHRGRSLDPVEYVLVEARLAGSDLQFGFAGDAIDRAREREQHALIRGVHADEDRDAEHDAGRRQRRAQEGLAEVRPADQPEQDHRRMSSTTLPSRSAMVRSQLPATFMSCVTITTVDPRRLWTSRISIRIPSPVRVSRFPVGSSARMIGG